MRQKTRWVGRWMGGLAALVLLSHCGGSVAVEEQGLNEPQVQALVTRGQELDTTYGFGATADARVEAAFPTANFGGEEFLGADLSPEAQSYLRFIVSGVTGPVSSAKLRLWVTDGTSDGPRVYLTEGGWTEGGLTWNNRPALISGPLDDKGALSIRSWVEFDVTSVVRGNGELNFALIPTSRDGTDFASRNFRSPFLQPQLAVTFSSGCMPRQDRLTLGASPSDAYVAQNEPTRNFGRLPALLVDGSPRLESYLLFSVDTGGFSVVDARLELSAFDSTSNGPLLYRTGTSWTELGLTWNTRPALIGGPVGNLGPISAGSRVAYDVTGVVTGSGFYSFGLIPESNDGVDFYSREASGSGNDPRLTFTVETPPYCTYRGDGGGLTGWVRQLGGVGQEVIKAMTTDAEGGFVAAGLFGDAIFPDREGFALARYASDGSFLWGRVLATDDVFVRHLTVAPTGHIFVVGNYEGSPDFGMGPLPPVPDETGNPPGLFVTRFSPDGELLWVRTFAARSPASGFPTDGLLGEVATDAEGNLLLTGGYLGELDLGGGPLPQSPSGTSGFLAKFSANGTHLWSRGFTTEWFYLAPIVNTVTTDAAGSIYAGGMASATSDLGGGPLGASGPFIARYTPGGSLQWARVFSGSVDFSVMEAVRSLDEETVAFAANIHGTFTFGGTTYTGDASGGFVGTLSAAGGDGWLRQLSGASVRQLAVWPGAALTVSGGAFGPFDPGGGTLSRELKSSGFVVRYSGAGGHLWSRIFDSSFAPLLLGQQPGGAVVLGGNLSGPLELDGRTFTPNGPGDLFYLQLNP